MTVSTNCKVYRLQQSPWPNLRHYPDSTGGKGTSAKRAGVRESIWTLDFLNLIQSATHSTAVSGCLLLNARRLSIHNTRTNSKQHRVLSGTEVWPWLKSELHILSTVLSYFVYMLHINPELLLKMWKKYYHSQKTVNKYAASTKLWSRQYETAHGLLQHVPEDILLMRLVWGAEEVLMCTPFIIQLAIPIRGCEGHRVVKCQGSHIFYTIGSQMAVRLSALLACRPLPPGKFLIQAESTPGP
jgi:hypothetical protein